MRTDPFKGSALKWSGFRIMLSLDRSFFFDWKPWWTLDRGRFGRSLRFGWTLLVCEVGIWWVPGVEKGRECT